MHFSLAHVGKPQKSRPASHKMDTIATPLPLTIQSVKAAIPGLSSAVDYNVPLDVALVQTAFGAPLDRVIKHHYTYS